MGNNGGKISITVSLSPELYRYIKTMSKIRGLTRTEFVSEAICESYSKNAEKYAEVKKLLSEMDSL